MGLNGAILIVRKISNLTMKSLIEIDYLSNNDLVSINQIAKWYYHEWQTPIDKTIKRLTQQANNDLIFQLTLTVNNLLISTVGLCKEVNIFKVYPEFKRYSPWLALLYTDKEYRGKGFGEQIVSNLMDKARSKDISEIYLYTFTAEKLYKKLGWQEITRIRYKGNDTALLKFNFQSKNLKP